ncbi:hypothetical protein [Streptomyces sp. NPDC088748]|uniref:hypothetical protein n=1 Tax=Streptomyces sp. NPDC088748 TaxID=3365887 RepID=UPI003809A6A8
MMNRGQDDDLQTLCRMLPIPAERDFPAGRRHQREEHLMTSLLTMSRRADKRGNLRVRIALPAGLAAVVAGIALTALPAQTAAAYTLQKENGGLIKITIIDPASKINLVDELQKDLDRLGINGRVYAGDPNCTTAPSQETNQENGPIHHASDIDAEDGKVAFYVNPDIIPAGKHLQIVFPLAQTEPDRAWSIMGTAVVDSPGPDCVPAMSPVKDAPPLPR